MRPRISIVTPSLNQREFLEDAMCSVLEQNYPNLEYIVIDGGSTDGSVELIQQYAKSLAHWVSEPDDGQAHAINKGLQRATGDVVAYLNGDDTYMPGAFEAIVAALDENPSAQWVCGPCLQTDERSGDFRLLVPEVPDDPSRWLFKPSGARYRFPQPGVFLRKSLVDALGMFREDLHYSFDYEYFQRALFAGYQPVVINTTLATFRIHHGSKTGSNSAGFAADDLAVADLYFNRVSVDQQRQLRHQKHWMTAWRIVDRCAGVARTQGRGAARRVLWQQVLRDPSLLQYRPVWGALRRWYSWTG